MGIFNFFGWFKNRFPDHIYQVQHSISEVPSGDDGIIIDNLLIDANGLFHTSTQKVYKYGNFKPYYPILVKENRLTQKQVHEDVCNTIEQLLITVNPRKRLIIAIDGPAVLAKQTQQRSRRFKSSLERAEDDQSFDSTKISPGTEFMDYLSKYIDWFIRERISTNPIWQEIEVIFSNEKVESEGEHKLMSYVRKYGNCNESFCIHGLDADLIMLSLATHMPYFYVLRDDLYNRNNNFLFIDIGSVRKELIEVMRWQPFESPDIADVNKFNERWAINDFVFLCFLLGNDFLHHIPSLEIVEDGIEIILDICRGVGRTHGHITISTLDKDLIFSKHSFKEFLRIVADMEKNLLETKFKNRAKYFPDDLLTSCCDYDDTKFVIDIDGYREKYNEEHFGNDEKLIEEICNDYLTGLQWILTYYFSHVPSWTWAYNKTHYSPLASTLVKYIDKFKMPTYVKGRPFLPFLQLMNILPPNSARILPSPLDRVVIESLSEYYPKDTKVDVSGKKQEYQGIVLLPPLDHNLVKKLYDKNIMLVASKDTRRNVFGKTLVYQYSPRISRMFKSFYGDIKECKVYTKIIEI